MQCALRNVAKMKLWNNKWNRVYFCRSIENWTWTYCIYHRCLSITFPHHENSIQHKTFVIILLGKIWFSCWRHIHTHIAQPKTRVPQHTLDIREKFYFVFIFIVCMYVLCGSKGLVCAQRTCWFLLFTITILLTSAKYNTKSFHLLALCLYSIRFDSIHFFSLSIPQFEILILCAPCICSKLFVAYSWHCIWRILLLFLPSICFILSINWLCKLKEVHRCEQTFVLAITITISIDDSTKTAKVIYKW